MQLGGKRNSKGVTTFWRGYKLHVDVGDGGLPIAALLTSASVHDSQAAVPLMQKSAMRVVGLYDVADSAYDAEAILDFSRSLGHVPVVDANKRRGAKSRKWIRRRRCDTTSAAQSKGSTPISRTTTMAGTSGYAAGKRCSAI